MLKAFVPLKEIFEQKNQTIDNLVFKLHYVVTSRLTIVFALLVTAREFISEPINCMLAAGSSVPREVINSYCWIQSTYSLPKTSLDGIAVIYPGVDTTLPDDSPIVHQYYQWVPFFLATQTLCFYLPIYIWRSVEKGKIGQIVGEFASPIVSEDSDQRTESLQRIANYIWDYWGHFGWYSGVYFMCEVLNFLNVVLQIVLTDLFLGGAFFTFGVAEKAGVEQVALPFFPLMAKCAFRNYGPSGDIQNYGAICVLPINMFNEKIFMFLRAYFVFLAVVSGMTLIFRLALLASKRLRLYRLRHYNRLAEAGMLNRIVEISGITEWLFLNFLSKNMNLVSFKELVEILNRGCPSGECPFNKGTSARTPLI